MKIIVLPIRLIFLMILVEVIEFELSLMTSTCLGLHQMVNIILIVIGSNVIALVVLNQVIQFSLY